MVDFTVQTFPTLSITVGSTTTLLEGDNTVSLQAPGLGLAKAYRDAAQAARDAAQTSETNAAATYDAFDDRYLGNKASNPTLDNDGAALLTGALYYNTAANNMRVYSGTSWSDVSGLSEGDKGDITVAASGATWTVDTGAITLAKMANMATASFIARNTAAAGVPEIVPAATAKTMLALVKGDVGLGSVDNTTDAAKPVSTAMQTALNDKAPLASPTFTGTVAGITKAMVGLGSVDNTTDAAKPVSTATQTALNDKAPLASPTFTGTVAGITSTMVGLGSVDNTTDAAKPVSTATQTALNAKAGSNYIINGNFDIWQRGTSQTSADYASDDRWLNANGGTTKTHSQQSFALGQTAVPGEPRYFSRTVVTSVAGAANYVIKVQRMASVRTLAGQTATLSFWAKADATKNIAVEFKQIFGTGGTPSAAVTGIGSQLVALTTAWQKFEITVTVPSISGKTLGTNNNDYSELQYWFDAGSDWNARSASLGQQSGTFDIAQVKVEAGTVATNFVAPKYTDELHRCQPYYQIPPREMLGFATAATNVSVQATLPTPMRVAPTLTLITTSPASESPWFTTVVTPSGTAAIVAGAHLSTTSIGVELSGYTGLTVGQSAYVDGTSFTLEAEL